MPREGKQSITVDIETAKFLAKRKRDTDTWDDYLKRCARVENPQPDKEDGDEQPPLSEQTEIHIEPVEHDVGFDVFWWPHGGMFLVSPESHD